MALKGSRVTVTPSATPLSTAGGATGEGVGGSRCLLRNRSASVSVDVGGPTVATGAGFELGAGEYVTIDLDAGEVPYAIAVSGTVRVDVLMGGI